MVQGIFIIVIFLVFAVLLATKKLSAFYSLILMGIIIGLVCGLPITGDESIATIIVNGTSYLQGTVFLILVACWLAQLMNTTGVTNTIIKKAAELGGDRPFVVTLLINAACIFLFTTLFGTGACMMVGAIAIPLMLSVGVPPVKAVNFFMATYAIGLGINSANVAAILNITGCTEQEILLSGIIIMACGTLHLLFQYWQTFRKGSKSFAFAAPVKEEDDDSPATSNTVKGVRGILACCTPVLIVVLIMVFSLNALFCYYIAIAWMIVMTWKGRPSKYLGTLTTCFTEACKDAAAPISICLGIGMCLTAMMCGPVQEALAPVINAILPASLVGMCLFFCILAPMSCYRGLFATYGLGAGLMTLMMSSGFYSPLLISAIFNVTMRWGNESCPTSTINVWAANFVGSDSVTTSNKVWINNYITSAVSTAIVIILYFGR